MKRRNPPTVHPTNLMSERETPKVARVIVELSLDREFDYAIPESMASDIKVGMEVLVPFSKSERRGHVLSLAQSSDYPKKLKSILCLHDTHPRIPDTLVSLGEWIAQYYCCSKEKAVRAMLPAVVRGGKIRDKHISYISVTDAEKAQDFILKNQKRSPSKTKILEALLNEHETQAPALLKILGCTRAPLTDLIKKGLVNEEERLVSADPFKDIDILPAPPPTLTEEQTQALSKIQELMEPDSTKHTLLLHGVTGSGKTEVYLQAISKTLDKGRSAIVLVPEISLTPQTVERFRSRFGNMVSVQHSGLTDRERFDEWSRINQGAVNIVVGARSALFAPFKNLGLIIVDEEHEHTYKQEEAPRYHARDMAVMRGYREKAVVILGSATPSMESYHNAMSGKYALAVMSKRVEDVPMPKMRVLDLKMESMKTGKPQIFTQPLVEEIRVRLEKGEQTILFLNRRGFAKQLACPHCGFVASCDDCSISYTYHRAKECLQCHLCGAIRRAPNNCPDCGADDIKYSKLGTERIESLVSALFPYARAARMDSDTMVNRHSYEKVLNEFKRGNVDILIGTQMIAKGLDFPNVTLVGILNADISLHIPDFRSLERTFQLLTQVAGRAGRGQLTGEVVIQTYSPFNPAVQYAINHDYVGFYQEEMLIRDQLSFPPTSHLIAVHVRGEDETAVAAFANEIYQQLQPILTDKIIHSEPIPSPLARVKSKFRYLMIFRGAKLTRFRKYLRHILFSIKIPKGIDIHADVDALNLM